MVESRVVRALPGPGEVPGQNRVVRVESLFMDLPLACSYCSDFQEGLGPVEHSACNFQGLGWVQEMGTCRVLKEL